MSTIVLATAVACGPSEPVPLPPFTHVGEVVALPDDPAREFDFWVGTWEVRNKHLGFGGRWKDTGQAVARIHSVAGGRALLERWSGEAKGRLEGFSLRSWDPEIGKWIIALNWHGGRPAGFFVMHGERQSDSIHLFPPGGRSARYTFSQAHEGSCQWASSTPAGDDWTTDWVMQFERTRRAERADAPSEVIESPPISATNFPATRELDFLLGKWEGQANLADGSAPLRIEVAVTSMLEGFGLLQFLDTGDGRKTLLALAHDPEVDNWRGYRADSAVQGLEALSGALGPEGVRFQGRATRESWSRLDDGTYLWEREVAAGNGGWRSEIGAELRRTGG